jgi:hypothetical protein
MAAATRKSRPDPVGARDAKHLAAVERSLTWADESAARGDHADALAWLNAVLAVDDELSEGYETKRHAWQLACRAGQPGN